MLALLGASAWIVFAIGMAAHTASEIASPDATHDSADCPICQTAGSFVAVPPDPPRAFTTPGLPCGHEALIASAPRARGYRSELARGPPRSLIT